MLRQILKQTEAGEDVIQFCLDRIAQSDPHIRAWVTVAPQPPLGEGPLSGVPFGAKDIFDTAGLPTEYGSPLFAGRRTERDAAVVESLRRAGALLLGKTQTAALAYFDPPPTRNPRDLRRTPGGSSSGSAAAVAAGQVPFALGSQTQGSVLRPASFCGVTGFKPTIGLLPTSGVLAFAPSLDTVGLFTETAADMQILWMRGFGGREAQPFDRIGAVAAGDKLRQAGLPARDIRLPDGFDRLLDAVRLINDYEGARTHRELFEQHGESIGARLAILVRSGMCIPEDRYQAARETVARMQKRMATFFLEWPVIATEAAMGAAPIGLSSTGDPRANSPWTGLGVPAISIPVLESEGMPLGLQLTAARGDDSRLLATAVEIERRSGRD